MSWLPRWSFKQWLALTLTGFVALIFLLVALVLWIAQDEPLLDDSDLRIAPAEGRDYKSNDNGYQRLLALTDVMDNETGPDIQDLLEAKEGQPDWEAIRQRLVENQEALQQIDHILAAPYFTIEWPPVLGAKLPGFSESLWWARWQAGKARLSLHDGNSTQAWEELVPIIRLGRRIVDEDAFLVNYLVGIAIQAIAIHLVEENVLSFSPSAPITRQRTDWLKQFLSSKANVERVFRYEYRWALSALEAVDKGNLSIITSDDLSTGLFFYKPKQTRNLFLLHFREFIQNVDRPIKDIALPRFEKTSEGLTLQNVFSGNVSGHYLIGLSLPSTINFLYWNLEAGSRLQLSRLSLALAGYANEHGGALPEKLETLAPTYIDAIPLDPITEEAFFYSREQRKVWSVGRDLNDDGGLPRGDRERDDPHDLVIEIPEL